MSQQTRNQDTHLANFTGVVLVLTFIIIFALISRSSNGLTFTPIAPTQEAGQAVAQVVLTATDQPTVTSLPATATFTFVPTNTPAPTATPRPSNTPEPTETPQAVTDTAQSGESADRVDYDPAVVELGQTLFVQCAACHGVDARGIPNLGKDLVGTEFITSQSDEELRQFIITGRPIWDPDNTTGIDMPGRGGNPALTNDDILAIIAYIRSLSSDGG